MFTYEEAKHFLIENLSHDVHLHLEGDFANIGKNYDYCVSMLPRSDDPKFKTLFIGLDFWDSWQDARNHDWMFYEGIKEADWPELANIIIADLKADREITNELILEHFFIKPKSKSVFRRIASFLSPKT